MEYTKVLIDTSIIIDYIRTVKKEKSLLYMFFENNVELYISSVTTFEIYNGLNAKNRQLIDIIFSRIIEIPFNNNIAKQASTIYSDLRKRNQIIEIRDIFIAASAIKNDLSVATKNVKHFNRIDNLSVVK